MNQRMQFGRHVGVFVPPDLIWISFSGDITREEGRRMSEWFATLAAGRDARYLVDVRALGNIAPDARKELAAPRGPRRDNDAHTVDLAFIGATMRTKVLMTVVMAAAGVVSNVKVRTHFFSDVAAGVAWASVDAALFAA